MKRIEAKKLAKQLFDMSIKICLMARHGRPNKDSINSMRKILDSLEGLIEGKAGVIADSSLNSSKNEL